MKYPEYFQAKKELSTELQASSSRPEWLDVKAYQKPLDGFMYANQSGAFSFRYNASKEIWEPSEAGISQDFAPIKKIIPENGAVYYYVKTGDAATGIETAFIESLGKKLVVEISLSSNGSYRECINPCPEMKPFSDEGTFTQILSTFRFVP